MSIDFTGKVITKEQLRDEVGAPSADPTSVTFTPDYVLQGIIDYHLQSADTMLTEKVDALGLEELLTLRNDAQPVTLTGASGDTQYPNMSKITIPARYYPFPFSVTDQTSGDQLFLDPNIHQTQRLTNGIYTAKRYNVFGDDLVMLPSTTTAVTVQLLDRDDVEEFVLADVVEALNDKIVEEARRVVENRTKVAMEMKNESRNEAP